MIYAIRVYRPNGLTPARQDKTTPIFPSARFGPVVRTRNPHPANGATCAKHNKKVEKCRHAVMQRHPCPATVPSETARCGAGWYPARRLAIGAPSLWRLLSRISDETNPILPSSTPGSVALPRKNWRKKLKTASRRRAPLTPRPNHSRFAGLLQRNLPGAGGLLSL